MIEEAIREVAQALYDRANDETWCDENPSSLKSVWVDGDVDFISLAEAAIAAWNRRAGGEREAWQPIETAPAQKVLLLFAITFEEDGIIKNWKMATGCKDHEGAWEWGGHRLHAWDHFPTHWQPLPAPPRAALAGQTEGERNG